MQSWHEYFSLINYSPATAMVNAHDNVIKWGHFSHYWPFVRGIHRWPVNSPHKGQWRGALMFSFTYAWISGWVNNREAGKLRRRLAHYDVIVMDDAIHRSMEKLRVHNALTQWGPVTHIWVNTTYQHCLRWWPVRCKSIIWSNAAILSTRP